MHAEASGERPFSSERCESSNHRPGEPLREWQPEDTRTGIDFDLLVKKAGARDAIAKLAWGKTLSADETISLGRLNSHCVLEWFEPMVILVGTPTLIPSLVEIARAHTEMDR